MADRIQNRRDTKARWQQYNPILLEGEIGIVTDDPNLYKVGDGTKRWNELPYRGFNGTVSSEVTKAENTVPSNKAVSDYVENTLDALKEDIIEFTLKDYGTASSKYGGAPKIDYGNASTTPTLL